MFAEFNVFNVALDVFSVNIFRCGIFFDNFEHIQPDLH